MHIDIIQRTELSIKTLFHQYEIHKYIDRYIYTCIYTYIYVYIYIIQKTELSIDNIIKSCPT